MVSAFYRLSRLPAVGQTPPDVAQIGKLFRQAQDYWGAGSPLSLLVDRRIAIVRNSEAHKHTDLDLRSERFTFISKDPAGVEKDRWSASPADFQRLAVHCFHLGELMRTVLMVVAFRSAGPETLVEALTHLWKRPTPEAD
jgi:hypothetical protein